MYGYTLVGDKAYIFGKDEQGVYLSLVAKIICKTDIKSPFVNIVTREATEKDLEELQESTHGRY